MKILLEIPEDTLGKYQFEADKEKRSRKNFMEKVLVDYFEKPKTIVQDLTKPTNEIKPQEQPKTNYQVNIPQQNLGQILGSFETYKLKIENSKTREELEKIGREIKNSMMKQGEKMTLQQIAQKHFKDNFFND